MIGLNHYIDNLLFSNEQLHAIISAIISRHIINRNKNSTINRVILLRQNHHLLNCHIRVVSITIENECNRCGKYFDRKINLNTHVKQVWIINAVKSYFDTHVNMVHLRIKMKIKDTGYITKHSNRTQ